MWRGDQPQETRQEGEKRPKRKEMNGLRREESRDARGEAPMLEEGEFRQFRAFRGKSTRRLETYTYFWDCLLGRDRRKEPKKANKN